MKADIKILFVDDDPIAHEMFKDFSEQCNWDVKYAYAAEEALEILDKEFIMIVITDVVMPGMSGVDLLRSIKKKHGMIQVIMITASHEIENIIESFEAGANDFLLKPISKGSVEEAVQHTISRINRWRSKMDDLLFRRH